MILPCGKPGKKMNHTGRQKLAKAGLAGHADQPLQALLLLGQAVVLDLDEEVLLSQDLSIPARGLAGGLLVSAQEVMAHLRAVATTEHDEAVLVPAQKLKIYSRPVVKAFEVGPGGELN